MPGDFGDGYSGGDGRYTYQGSVNPNDPSLANGGVTPEQWAAYQSRRKRDRILGILGIAGGTIGLGALGAIGSGAAGATTAASASGSLPPIAGGAPWAVAPYAGTAAMAPTGAAVMGGTVGAGATGASAAGAAGGGAGSLASLRSLTPRDWLSIAGTGIGTVGALTSNPLNTNPNTATTDPGLQRLLESMQRRLDKSEPLYDSVMSMANGLLPTQYQNGGR